MRTYSGDHNYDTQTIIDALQELMRKVSQLDQKISDIQYTVQQIKTRQ